ncbi:MULTISPECIES: hypothetical protein [unclassified Lysobacter]|uniref:hypothetical protein n=1 Tax=unclassified Lysobacter TaxID=2635362 RepID=UPI001BE6C977|nr:MULTISPECIES: hypothetical protein [unclassified Lysobacter]MBT2746647.1 hypothetical protein [Lysobacter sp. ISL-42]MBT2753358.1 hypothetical protein [Lysobacter sp. ISL-50]MBT2775468.1 hypothetical protein [Lysobacter sp. ISL-54]MBT2782996.1 hypothetical protein [Lysobacter sp. ISL-52]
MATGLTLSLLLGACGGQAERQAAAKPQPPAGQPLDPAKTAERLVKMRSQALGGDQQGLQQNLKALNEDVNRSIRLADPGRRIDRENARIAAKGVKGVRSVVWLDSENLFVIVNRNAERSYGTIDSICGELEPLGDTLGVVVNVQSGAARNGDELEILSRNCQLKPGERAMMQANRQVDALPPQVRAQHRANADAALRAERAEDRQESDRIIQTGTPEM